MFSDTPCPHTTILLSFCAGCLTGIDLFSQHCAREFSSENVLFWCAVSDYKAKFDVEKCIPEKSSAHEATAIYKHYIADGNTQVNLSSKQRSDIKKTIDSGRATRGTFDAAQREIFAVMSRDSYPRFLASKKNRQLCT